MVSTPNRQGFEIKMTFIQQYFSKATEYISFNLPLEY